MKGTIKVFGILLALGYLGCSGDLNNRQIDVRQDLVLNLLPSLNSFSDGLNFSFQSDSLYDCQNVGFDYTLKSNSDGIHIHLLGVNIPQTCIGGTAPAFEMVRVPGGVGYYAVTIDIGDYVHNTGSLFIDDTTCTLFLNSQVGIRIPEPLMHLIPDGTVWGYAIPADVNQQNEVIHLVRNSFGAIAEASDLSAGYYGYFTVSDQGEFATRFPDYHSAASSFVFHFTQDRMLLENSIEAIRDQLPAGTDFRLFTWDGLQY